MTSFLTKRLIFFGYSLYCLTGVLYSDNGYFTCAPLLLPCFTVVCGLTSDTQEKLAWWFSEASGHVVLLFEFSTSELWSPSEKLDENYSKISIFPKVLSDNSIVSK